MQDLKKVWIKELEILEKVDAICKKNNIKYFADSGTLLGAVRHQGFIPWDDDIDLVMFRKDFNRFRRITKKEIPTNLFCQSGYNDKGFYGGMLHIRMNNTTAIQLKNFPCMRYHQGIFIDVFPLDGVIQNRFFLGLQSLCKQVLNVILWYKNTHGRKRKLKHHLVLFLPSLFPQKFLFGLFEFVCSWKKADKSEYVDTVAYFGTSGVGSRKRKLYDNLEFVPFENICIPIPSGYHEILEVMYGKDYMTPKQIPTDHGDMFFDTKYSYLDYLTGKRTIK